MNRPPNSLPAPGPTPFDPELSAVVERVRMAVDAPLTPEKIEAARRRSVASELDDKAIAALGFETEEIAGIKQHPSEDGSRLLICRPGASVGPLGFLYHIHGGGMVAGSWRSSELALDLVRARQLGLSVISVDYRRAPEHPFPAPLNDCYRQLAWVEKNSVALNLDREKIILSGNSAGGGLAAWLALQRRDSRMPPLLGMMLQCPMLDDRCDSISARQFYDRGVWDTISNRTGWEALLGSRDREKHPKQLTPASHGDLGRLPPTFIDVGSAESLRDEALAFAQRIWEAGGDAELHVWSGAFHSFDQWVPGARISRSAEAARISWLSRILS